MLNYKFICDIISNTGENMEQNILSFEEATIWALYHKEKITGARRASLAEIRTYARKVISMAKQMFGYEASFKSDKKTIDNFVSEYEHDLKFRPVDSTIRLKTYASTKYLIFVSSSKRQISLELHRALGDEMLAKSVFEQKEKERE